MRVRTIVRLLIAAIVFAAVVVVALQFDAVSVFGRRILSSVGISESRRIESSRIVLREVREVYQLSTIEYVYRTVFPYDFMDPSVSIGSIMETLRTATGSVETLLSPEEREYFQAYNLSREVGLATGGDEYEFLVVSVVVGAGYDLSDTVLALPSALSDDELAQTVRIREEIEDGGVVRSISLPLPETVITHVVIEDRDTASYPYPDVSIQPDGWRRVADFVSERVRERTIDDGILTEAAERGRTAIRSLLLGSGYDRVEFRPTE